MRKGLFVLCGIAVVALTITGFAADRSQFLFLGDIRIGMRGVGKTVVAGDQVAEFAVEVLGIIDEPGDRSDFIVVRVSGEAIGRSGGIAQGMSGSPVYVDGKLIGALSRAAAWSKEITPIGLVTPIEQMLGILDSVKGRSVSAAPAPEAVLQDVQVAEVKRAPGVALVESSPNTLFAYPVATPLLVTGLSGRALDLLMRGADAQMIPTGLVGQFLVPQFAPKVAGLSSFGLNLAPVAGGASGESSTSLALEPGSAIGVGLVTGDFSIGALGTLTYREGDAIVGFGHPFLSNGKAAFPLTSAHVVDTIKAYDASFKLGSLGPSIGAIFEDRLPGIAGRIDQAVPSVRVSFGVLDLDRGQAKTLNVSLVDEPRITWELLLASGFEAIDGTLDRIGQGTVEVTYQILGDGMPAPLERRDLFLSSSDVALYPPWQLASIVSALQYNPFQDPKITRIAASMQVTRELKAAQINHLELDQDEYMPGDTIHYRVELQTYHGKTRTEEGEILIPDELLADYLVVRAYAGPRDFEVGESPREFSDLGELIEAIEDLPSYDTLTVELFVPDPLLAGSGALLGVAKVRAQIGGYFLYDEREVTTFLFLPG